MVSVYIVLARKLSYFWSLIRTELASSTKLKRHSPGWDIWLNLNILPPNAFARVFIAYHPSRFYYSVFFYIFVDFQ